MGLGFLLAGQEGRHYRLVFSGEVHPIYVETLRRNHKILAEVVRPERPDAVPQQVKPLDLRAAEAVRQAEAECRADDGIDGSGRRAPVSGILQRQPQLWAQYKPSQ